ncbi:Protein SDA1 [Lamellibrachia satsuma]|nr:Protein SDA1 [Lamellibrachia satsuma]
MSTKNNNKLPNNLPQLQNWIKRDAGSYHDEFRQQFRHYESTLQVFLLKPSAFNETLSQLVMFLAQVSQCYPEDLAGFPQQLKDILHQHSTVLDPEMRMTLCQALILMRNRGLVTPTLLLELFFELFRCQDTLLRKTLRNYIVQDIKKINVKHRNAKVNRTLQNFMYTMLRDNNAIAAKMSLDVMIELYTRNIWKDSKTVNVITTALFSKVTKLVVAALKFFLGHDEEEEEESESEDDEVNKRSARELLLANRVAKKTKKRHKRMERALTVLKKHKKKKKAVVFNFSAIHLIHDPQGLAEKLFRQLESSNERFEVKLLMMNLVSRLIGIHQLFLFNFYPFVQRFLQPHQREVTRVLVYAAQASHELVPPEILESVVMTIANNFITERNSSEVMAVGLNAVREICNRSPLALSSDLLHDLVEYKTYKDKSVMMAAKSLIQLYRERNPQLLHKKDRGKPTEAMRECHPLDYGEMSSKDYLPGAELLKEGKDEPEDQDAWEEEEVDEDNDSDGSWVDVSHSSGEEVEEEVDTEQLTAEERIAKAKVVSHSRILTQEDFKRMRTSQLAKQMQTRNSADGKGKRKHSEVSSQELEGKEVVSLGDIERIHKKRRHDKESRLATVMAGREDRGKFGRKDGKMNPHASTSNKDKRKNKNYMMMKHKIRRTKTKRSFQEKQVALKKSMLKKMKNYKR